MGITLLKHQEEIALTKVESLAGVDWPLEVVNTEPRVKELRWLSTPNDVPSAHTSAGKVYLPLGYFNNSRGVDKKVTLTARSKKTLGFTFPELQIRDLVLGDEDMVVGLEEGVHIVRGFLKKEKQLVMDYPDARPKDEIKAASRIYGEQGSVTYYAEIGEEFGCFLMWSEIVERLYPELWKKGYDKLYAAVVKHRREKMGEERIVRLSDQLEVTELKADRI